MRELPNYAIEIDLDDEVSGLDAIALVEKPAVKVDFICFSEDERAMHFANDEMHIISGVAILADTPIYRNDVVRGEYTVTFSKEVIRKLVEKMSRDGLLNSVNRQHDDNDKISGCVMVESYIKDSERGVVPNEFADVPDGSWIVSYKVEDDDLWNEIKTSDKLNGFSVQGIFDLMLDKFAEKGEFDYIFQLPLEQRIELAIEKHYKVNLTYLGENKECELQQTYRDITITDYGMLPSGDEAIRAYMIKGETLSGATPWWRLFRLDRIQDLRVNTLTKRAMLPYPLYNFEGDKSFAVIYKKANYTKGNIDKAEKGQTNYKY